MRIGLCCPSWPPGATPNGIVTYASQMVPAFKELGHEVLVLNRNKMAAEETPDTVNLQQYSKWGWWDRVLFQFVPEIASFNAGSRDLASAVRELIEKKKLDVLEMEESFGLSIMSSRCNLLPIIVRLHGPWFLNGQFDDPNDDDIMYRRREEREGRAIQHADFVTAPSAEVLQSVKDHYKLGLAKSRVIYNPIKAAADANEWKSPASANDSILFVGRFDKRKGGDLVLRVFAELAASNPKLKLTFVGSDIGFKESDSKILSFEDFVRTYLPESCRSRIEFCKQIDHSSVMALRKQSFLTIIASQYEIMPYSVLEAMSVGSPLVATSVGGIPELIKDQRNGLLVPSQDTHAMVAACKKLLADPALAARLGRQARLDCLDLYNPKTIAQQTVIAYNEAIDAFKRKAQ